MLQTALALAKRKLSVFPCEPRGKTPLTPHGCKDATRDPETIRAWWEGVPAANVAVATGTVSGVFVVDIDSGEAETALKKLEAEHGALPPTVEAITARGRHLYLKVPTDVAVHNTASRIAPGVDTRGEGGYALVPPSVHPSGRRYAWSVDSANAFADAPEWLLLKIAAPANGTKGNGATPPAAWLELIRGVNEGARDDSATRLAGYLLRHRLDPFVTLEILRMWNGRCTPPLPEADIDRIVDSICGRELQRRHRGGPPTR